MTVLLVCQSHFQTEKHSLDKRVTSNWNRTNPNKTLFTLLIQITIYLMSKLYENKKKKINSYLYYILERDVHFQIMFTECLENKTVQHF